MAQVSFRIDDNLKSHAESIFNGMGMNLSTAITIFIRQTIDRQALPFEVRACANPLADPARIRAAVEDYRNGKRNYHLHELPPLAETTAPHRKHRSRRHAKAAVAMQKLWSDLAIDEANRLIFRIDDGQLVISSCMGHYE